MKLARSIQAYSRTCPMQLQTEAHVARQIHCPRLSKLQPPRSSAWALYSTSWVSTQSVHPGYSCLSTELPRKCFFCCVAYALHSSRVKRRAFEAAQVPAMIVIQGLSFSCVSTAGGKPGSKREPPREMDLSGAIVDAFIICMACRRGECDGCQVPPIHFGRRSA